MTSPPAPRRSGSRSTTAGRESGDATRRALLSAAHDLLATEGAAALSVRRIAAAAGVSTMNVYSRFGGKDGVLEELFVDGFTRLAESMLGSEPSDDPIADLRSCGVRYRRFALDNPTYYSLMFDKVVPEFEPSAEAMEAALGALGRVVERVERAMEMGRIPRGDAFNVAAGLWASVHGLVILQMRFADDEIFDWDRITAAAIDALTSGYGAAQPRP